MASWPSLWMLWTRTEYAEVSLRSLTKSKALIDGPATGVKRQAVNFRNLSLTDFKIKISHSAHAKSVLKVSYLSLSALTCLGFHGGRGCQEVGRDRLGQEVGCSS